MKIHEKYIARCIEIGKNGLGTSRPNPMVGCVIVCNEKIIGEGFTSSYGDSHAEVNAINSVKNKSNLKDSSLYVTLEPCSHFGKTPPCTNLILKYGIKNIIIGCIDDNEKVAGKGISKLREAGCQVIVGVLEELCKYHHKRFLTFHSKKRPFIILKWAQSIDGFMAPQLKSKQGPIWITNQYSRQLVHKWRAEEPAILIGGNTVLVDNPSLTTRDWKGQNPIRIVIDKHNNLSENFKVFDKRATTLSIQENSVESIITLLHKASINSVIIEGGVKTLQVFIDAGIWDEAKVFIGDMYIEKGIKAPKFPFEFSAKKNIRNDSLITYVNN